MFWATFDTGRAYIYVMTCGSHHTELPHGVSIRASRRARLEVSPLRVLIHARLGALLVDHVALAVHLLAKLIADGVVPLILGLSELLADANLVEELRGLLGSSPVLSLFLRRLVKEVPLRLRQRSGRLSLVRRAGLVGCRLISIRVIVSSVSNVRGTIDIGLVCRGRVTGVGDVASLVARAVVVAVVPLGRVSITSDVVISGITGLVEPRTVGVGAVQVRRIAIVPLRAIVISTVTVDAAVACPIAAVRAVGTIVGAVVIEAVLAAIQVSLVAPRDVAALVERGAVGVVFDTVDFVAARVSIVEGAIVRAISHAVTVVGSVGRVARHVACSVGLRSDVFRSGVDNVVFVVIDLDVLLDLLIEGLVLRQHRVRQRGRVLLVQLHSADGAKKHNK